MCDKAGVVLPERAGWHSLMRREITNIYHETTVKELPIIDYFRWSRKQRGLSQLPTYVKTPVAVTAREVLEQHPAVKMWKQVVPWLRETHPEYENNTRATQLYKQML
jgi:hypothetical protein